MKPVALVGTGEYATDQIKDINGSVVVDIGYLTLIGFSPKGVIDLAGLG